MPPRKCEKSLLARFPVRQIGLQDALDRTRHFFGDDIAIEFTPERGVIPFSVGTCRLEAADGRLTLKAEAENVDRLAEVEGIVERHLLRFAFRDPPKITWSAEGQAS